MSLTLGKLFDRNYNIRIPFLDGFYNVGIFFNKKSSFMLFNVDQDFSNGGRNVSNKVNMFKNLEASTFCETFLNLYTFKNNTLDIVNQFHKIKPEFQSDIIFTFNECITLNKTLINDRELYDTLTIYGFSMVSYMNEFIFILAERQNIKPEIGRKEVRTIGMQIGTNNSLQLMEKYKEELEQHRQLHKNVELQKENVVSLNDEEKNDK